MQHYLDDFLTLGPPASPVCHNNLQTCIVLCSRLGLPLHPDKLEGPSICLHILGIELDSTTLQARLPPKKRERIIAFLDMWSGKQFCRWRELESFIGNLHHAYKIAPQGRAFLRRMINLLCTFRPDDHPIRLNQEFPLDLTWWQELFQARTSLVSSRCQNGPPFFPFKFRLSPQVLWVMGPSSIISGSAALGHPLSNPYLYLTKSCFPSLWQHTCNPAYLFCSADGHPLTQQHLPSTVQSIIHLAGYSGSYSGHSFGIGAATKAAARGIPDHLIKTLGQWSSDAYQLYIRIPIGCLTQVSSQLA